jgi:ABC-type glycerol-3-phosphate transport system permease component
MKLLNELLKYKFLIIAGTFTIWPLLYVILGSFKTNQELISGGTFLPKEWTIHNYVQVWSELNFSLYFFNSVVFSLLSSVLAAILGSMSGYVFARSQFPGKKLMYALILSMMFISLGPMTLFPKFEMAVDFGLTASIFTITLVNVHVLGASLFLYEGYVKSLGREIDEAAIVDGANYFRRYMKIFFPLMMPIISTLFLLEFISDWNNYIFPLVMSIGNPTMKTLTVAVVELRNMGDGAAAWNMIMAGASVSILPMIIMFIIMNRHIVEGLTRGALKG